MARSSPTAAWAVGKIVATASIVAMLTPLGRSASSRSNFLTLRENTALRQQLIVLRRKLTGRVALTNGDRLFFGWLYRLFPSVAGAMLLARPETLLRWHRAGF